MISINQFIEIQVVGFLLLLALTPLFNIFYTEHRAKKNLCPFIEEIGDKSLKTVLIIILAFTVGVAGNSLIDELVKAVDVKGDEQYKKIYEVWAKDKNDLIASLKTAQAETPREKINDIQNNQGKAESLTLAEIELGKEKNEILQEYIHRHKFIMRLLRGAAVSSLLLLITIGFYEYVRWARYWKFKALELCPDRYKPAHYIPIAIFVIVFSSAYWFESQDYYKRICESYTKIDDCKICGKIDKSKAFDKKGYYLCEKDN